MHMRKMKYVPSPALLRSVILVPITLVSKIFLYLKRTPCTWSGLKVGGVKRKNLFPNFRKKNVPFCRQKTYRYTDENVSLYRQKRMVIQTKTYRYTDKNVSLYRQKRTVIQTKTCRYADKNCVKSCLHNGTFLCV